MIKVEQVIIVIGLAFLLCGFAQAAEVNIYSSDSLLVLHGEPDIRLELTEKFQEQEAILFTLSSRATEKLKLLTEDHVGSRLLLIANGNFMGDILLRTAIRSERGILAGDKEMCDLICNTDVTFVFAVVTEKKKLELNVPIAEMIELPVKGNENLCSSSHRFVFHNEELLDVQLICISDK